MKKKILAMTFAVMMIFTSLVFVGCDNKVKTEDEIALSMCEGWPEGCENGFIKVDGGRVLYHLYGKDTTGLPIIFLHGGPGGDSVCFCKQSALGANHPVVLYNQLGGDGPDYDEGTTLEQAQQLMTIEHYVNELQTVVDYFGFEEFMLAGCSWGSMLAVEYASAKQPEGLKGIILGGPFLNVNLWCADAERLMKSLPTQNVCGEMMDGNRMWQIIQECESNGIYYEDERYTAINEIYEGNFTFRLENEKYIGTSPSDAKVSKYKIDGLSVYDYMWGPSEFSCHGTLNGHDSTVLLQNITVPLLYVCGEYDCGTPETAQVYKSLSNNAEVTVIGGCAHSSAKERSIEYNAIVEGFAKRITE